MLSDDAVAAAYRAACHAELTALKPGNVHVFAAGHDMTIDDFAASAEASASVMGQSGLSVGGRILGAIERTRAVVDCNTNLGIVLLCAPLAQAALSSAGGSLRHRLQQVLTQLDVADAEQAFQAIRLAQPGGLGEAPRHDVRQPATAPLGIAMAEASSRDRIALQYCTDFADVFELGVPHLRAGIARWRSESWATTSAYLAFLAAFPDSHIGRRHGAERAMEVTRSARSLDARLQGSERPTELTTELLGYDAELKAAGLNPGTSADLTVASLFALRLEDAELDLADRGTM
jgi:triphosphoribosyl-dephospho-CoA synthase